MSESDFIVLTFTIFCIYVIYRILNESREIARFLINTILFLISVALTISWLVFCFGSVIIGVLLLIFAPDVFLLPMGLFLLGSKVVEKYIPNK